MADNSVISQGLNEVKSSIAELQKTANMSKSVKSDITALMETIVGIQAAISAMGEDYLSSSGKLRLTANIVFMQNYVKDLAKLAKEIGAYSENGKFAATRVGSRAALINKTNIKPINNVYSIGSRSAETNAALISEASAVAKVKMLEARASDAINTAITRESKTLTDYYKTVEKVNKSLATLSDSKSKLRVISASKISQSDIFNVSDAGSISLNEAKVRDSLDNMSCDVKRSTGSMIKDFFSFEKVVSRISFVITAKFSYEIINAIQRMVAAVPKLWKELEVSMSETFGILNQQGASVRKGLTDGVIELSKTYGVAAKEVSNALYEIISAQVKASDAINVLDTAIKLSLAGKGNIKDSVEALVEIMNAYDMGAKDVNRIADIAFQTSKYGQLTIAQYTSNMSKIVATASLMNIPIEEVSAAIATMTLNGVHAEQAFTSLNQMLMIIANPTDKAEKMMKQLGVNIKIADVRTLGLAGALSKLQPLMQFENNEEAITEIFKSRTGFKAFASLMKNNEEYVSNYINMINSSGVADAAFKEREFTLDVQTNRLKTTFEALTISIGKAFAPTQLKYVTTLSGFIETLNSNLWSVIASIKSLGITLATVIAVFSVQKIMGIFMSIKALFAMTKVELAALKANLASATAGISIIVGLISSLVLHIIELGKHKANLKLEEKFGIKKAREDLQSVNIELAKLNTAMNRFSGVNTMIEQWKELNSIQNKNPQQIKTMDMYFKGIESTMNSLGISVDNTGTKLEQIARYSAAASKEILDFNNKLLTLESRKAVLSLRAGTGETFADASTSKDYQIYKKNLSDYKNKVVKPVRGLKGLYPVQPPDENKFGSKVVMETMNKLRGDYQSISVSSDPVYLSKMYDKWNSEFDKLSKTKGVFTVETEQFRSRALEQINDNISLIIMRQQSLIKTPDVPKYKSTFSFTKDGSKVSMNTEDLKNQVLGNRVEGITVNEVKTNALKLIEDFRTEMSEKERNGDIIKNKDKVNADLAELTSAINDGTAEILASSLKRNLDETLVQLDTRSGLGENVSGDLLGLYVKMATEQSLLSPSTTKGKSDAASLSKAIIDKAKSLLSNSDYLNFMKDVGLLDNGLLMDYAYVNAAYNNASDPNLKSALKNVLDAMDDSINKVISDAAGTPQESKWLSAAKTALKNKIDEANKPLSNSEMKAYIDAVKAGLKEQGRVMTAAEETALTDINYDAKKQSMLFKLLGVKENKNPKDMIDDIGGQMVSGLQNLWTGYWDWEIRGIESQQKKKLELMDKEKAMMLANQNMSAEQRAIVEERYNEKRRIVEEKNARKIADMKKRQAKYDAGIELAKGLIGIWASYLKYPVIGAGLAGAASGALLALFASQMAIINQTKFAKGGFTGSGFGNVDETGQRPAGVVHANEMVFDAKSTMANLPELMSLYKHLNAGGNFNSFMIQKMNTGGYVSASSNHGTSPYISGNGNSGNTNITIDLKGIRTIDDVDISKIVERGNQKRRYISA